MKNLIKTNAILILLTSANAFAQPQEEMRKAPHGYTLNGPVGMNQPPSEKGPHEKREPVTRAEFMERAGKHFDKMDANKDGAISPEERKAMHEMRRDRRDQRHEMREKGEKPKN